MGDYSFLPDSNVHNNDFIYNLSIHHQKSAFLSTYRPLQNIIEFRAQCCQQQSGAVFTMEFLVHDDLPGALLKMFDKFYSEHPPIKTSINLYITEYQASNCDPKFAMLNWPKQSEPVGAKYGNHNPWTGGVVQTHLPWIEHQPVAQQYFTGLTRDPVLDKLPGLETWVAHPVTKTFYALEQVIINLNDSHGWTFEKIADWLETLDVDLTFPVKEGEDNDSNGH